MDDEIEELAKRTEKYKLMNLQHQQFLAKYSQIADEPDLPPERPRPAPQSSSRKPRPAQGQVSDLGRAHGSTAAESIDAICRKYQNLMGSSQAKAKDSRVQQAIDSLNDLKRELYAAGPKPSPALPAMPLSGLRDSSWPAPEFPAATQTHAKYPKPYLVEAPELAPQVPNLATPPALKKDSLPENSTTVPARPGEALKQKTSPATINKMLIRKPLKLAILKEHYRHRKMNEPIMNHEDSQDSASPRHATAAAVGRPMDRERPAEPEPETEEAFSSLERAEEGQAESFQGAEERSQIFEIEDDRPSPQGPEPALADDPQLDRWHNTLLTYSRDEEAAASRQTDPRDSSQIDQAEPQCRENSLPEHSFHEQSPNSDCLGPRYAELPVQETQESQEPADLTSHDQPNYELLQIDCSPVAAEPEPTLEDSETRREQPVAEPAAAPQPQPGCLDRGQPAPADADFAEDSCPQPPAEVSPDQLASIQCILQTLKDLAAEDCCPASLPESEIESREAVQPAEADQTIEHQSMEARSQDSRLGLMKKRLADLEHILFKQVWRF